MIDGNQAQESLKVVLHQELTELKRSFNCLTKMEATMGHDSTVIKYRDMSQESTNPNFGAMLLITRPRPSVQFLSFLCTFRKKSCQIIAFCELF